jgi:hypothetical protein
MLSSDSTVTQLSRGECLRLMGSVPVGRIVYTWQALPVVELVNFALDHGDIVVKTDGGSKLAAATRNAVVAFEADYVEPDKRAGWSVTVVGVSQEVTDAVEIAQLRQIGLNSWAPGTRERFIKISLTIVNGRRLPAGIRFAPGRRDG